MEEKILYIRERLGHLGIDNAYIEEKYNEPHRYYHNMEHIINMVGDQLESMEEFSDELFLSIIFHDIVYNPLSNTNEEDSLIEFMSMVKYNGLISEQSKNDVATAILETKNHKPTTDLSRKLIDLDLAILDSDFESFKKFEQNIRKEYSFVPTEIYKPNRIKILKELGVKKEYLYYVESIY